MRDIQVAQKRPAFEADIAFIASTADTKVLKQLTIFTTKWSSSVGGSKDAEDVNIFEALQAQMQDSLSRLINAGLVLDACKEQGDEWRIIRELVQRVDECGCVISLEALRDLRRQRWSLKRALSLIMCECMRGFRHW